MSFVFICLQYIMKRTLKVDKLIEIFTYIDQKKLVKPAKQNSWKGPAYDTLHTPLDHIYDIFWNYEKIQAYIVQ